VTHTSILPAAIPGKRSGRVIKQSDAGLAGFPNSDAARSKEIAMAFAFAVSAYGK